MSAGDTELRILPASLSALDYINNAPVIVPNSGIGERSMVVSMIDPVERGDVFEDDLPAHLTLLPWFRLDEDQWPVFDRTLADIMEDWSSLDDERAVLWREAHYGPNEDITVRKFGLFGPMFIYPLHIGVFSLVKRLGATFDETYAGIDNYSPHVSVPTGRTFSEGQRVTLDNVTVISRPNDASRRKVVRSVARWGDGSE